jgi:hypothetical protein
MTNSFQKSRQMSTLLASYGERHSVLDGLPETQASPYHPLLPPLTHWKLLEHVGSTYLYYGSAFTRETDLPRNPQTLLN